MEHDAELFEGRYQLAELLGEGGMGVVHAAINVYSGARVAIKRIPKEVADRGLSDRLRGESRVLALLDHPNIVRLLDCGPITGGGLYIAMELVEGDSLRALIRAAKKRGKLLDLDLVLPVIAQSAEAMEFAHRKGVYHRDLKPENIMVRKGGTVKVLDFGLAKAPSIGPIPGVHPTNPANVVGTPKYMAPEQVRGKAIDARTDVYGLGIVLYESLTARTPYDSHEDARTTVTELMGHHLFADPTPVREHVPTCPERLWNIIIRCLAKAPGDWYPDMWSLAIDIRAALDEMVAPSRAPAMPAVPLVASPAPHVDDTPAAQPGPREVRETEPMAMAFRAGGALPFAWMGAATLPDAPRVVRETEPMPASAVVVQPLPFVRPVEPPRLGVGFTQPLPTAATLLARQRALAPEPTESRPALPPPPSEPPPATAGSRSPVVHSPEPASQGRGRDSGDNGTRSGPGFAFEPTLSGSPRQQDAAPTPDPVAPKIDKPRRMKVSPYFVLPVGLVLAVFILVEVMMLRDPRVAERSASAPSASAPDPNTPDASAPDANPVATVAPKAPPASEMTAPAEPVPSSTARAARSTGAGKASSGALEGAPPRPGAPSQRVAPPAARRTPAAPAATSHRLFGAEQ